MSFFKPPHSEYGPTEQAKEHLLMTVKSLQSTLAALQQAPAYQAAVDLPNAQLLAEGITRLAILLRTIQPSLAASTDTILQKTPELSR